MLNPIHNHIYFVGLQAMASKIYNSNPYFIFSCLSIQKLQELEIYYLHIKAINKCI